MTPTAGLPFTCPSDGCPLRPFVEVRVSLGYTIRLHGCRFCNFNYVVGVASDPTGKTRPVGQWAYKKDTGEYILVQESGRNPPGWLDAAAAALSDSTAGINPAAREE